LSSSDGAALDVYGPLYNLSSIDSNHFGGAIDTNLQLPKLPWGGENE